LICKLLEVAQRTDISVALGPEHPEATGEDRQAPWLEGYDLQHYPGVVREDGAAALVETINTHSGQDPVVLAIGPLTTVAAALERDPAIAQKSSFVGMHGSFYRNFHFARGAVAEYNVEKDLPAAQTVFNAPWKKITITPLDTCGAVQFKHNHMETIRSRGDQLMQTVLDNYSVWLKQSADDAPPTESSILFDTVAIHLVFSTEFLQMQQCELLITDKGLTVEQRGYPEVTVAMSWRCTDSYTDYLVQRLLMPVVSPVAADSVA
jgi:inosine-uridine nucleoside N-ribohydrolase